MEYRLDKVDLNIRSNATPEIKKDKVHMKKDIEVGKNPLDSKDRNKNNSKQSKGKKDKVEVKAERYKSSSEDGVTGVFLDTTK